MITIDRFNAISINKGDEDKIIVEFEGFYDNDNILNNNIVLNNDTDKVCLTINGLNIHKTVTSFIDNKAVFFFKAEETINKDIGKYYYTIYVDLDTYKYKGVLHEGDFILKGGVKHEHNY